MLKGLVDIRPILYNEGKSPKVKERISGGQRARRRKSQGVKKPGSKSDSNETAKEQKSHNSMLHTHD